MGGTNCGTCAKNDKKDVPFPVYLPTTPESDVIVACYENADTLTIVSDSSSLITKNGDCFVVPEDTSQDVARCTCSAPDCYSSILDVSSLTTYTLLKIKVNVSGTVVWRFETEEYGNEECEFTNQAEIRIPTSVEAKCVNSDGCTGGQDEEVAILVCVCNNLSAED